MEKQHGYKDEKSGVCSTKSWAILGRECGERRNKIQN